MFYCGWLHLHRYSVMGLYRHAEYYSHRCIGFVERNIKTVIGVTVVGYGEFIGIGVPFTAVIAAAGNVNHYP
jgi:hypothetical protein